MSFSCIKLGLSLLWLCLSEATVVVKLIVNFFNVGEMFRNVVKKLFFSYQNTLNLKTCKTVTMCEQIFILQLFSNLATLATFKELLVISVILTNPSAGNPRDGAFRSFVFSFIYLALTFAEHFDKINYPCFSSNSKISIVLLFHLAFIKCIVMLR